MYFGEMIDLDAARVLMDDDLANEVHATVESDQEFMDKYAIAHAARYGVDFVLN
jgi:hypothetical protein